MLETANHKQSEVYASARASAYNMASNIAVSDGTNIRKSGIIFVEARIRDKVDFGPGEAEACKVTLPTFRWIRDGREDLLSVPSQTFDMGEDILSNQ